MYDPYNIPGVPSKNSDQHGHIPKLIKSQSKKQSLPRNTEFGRIK